MCDKVTGMMKDCKFDEHELSIIVRALYALKDRQLKEIVSNDTSIFVTKAMAYELIDTLDMIAIVDKYRD